LVITILVVVPTLIATALPDEAARQSLGISATVTSTISAGVCAWFGWHAQGAERRWRLFMAASMTILVFNVASGLWLQPSIFQLPAAANRNSELGLVGSVVTMVGLLTFPSGGDRGWPQTGAAVRGQARGWYWTLVLDGLVVVGSSLLLAWDSLLRSVFASLSAAGRTPWTISMIALLCELTLLVMIVLVAVFRDPRNPVAWALIGAGVAALAATGGAVTYQATTSSATPPPVLFAGSLLGPLLIAFAAATRVPARGRGSIDGVGATTDADDALAWRGQRERRWRLGVKAHTFGPYVLLGATGTLIVARHALTGAPVDAVELVAGLTLTGVVVIRQVLVVRDNANLARRVQASQHELRYRAFHDPLTGLPNRALFQEKLRQAVRAHADQARPFAVLFLDLDGFKSVNDEVGHDVGDRVLRTVAERLRSIVRGEDTVARFGGDEFAVLLDSHGDPTALGDRLLAAVAEPLRLGPRSYSVSASAGLVVARSTDAALDPGELLRNADEAMYGAKSAGKGVVMELFAGDRPPSGQPLHLDLAAALAGDPGAGAIDVRYEPIVDLRSAGIYAIRALARWAHPSRGPVSATLLESTAERAGLVEALDLVVLDRACRDLAHWRALDPHAPRLQVNISATLTTSESLIPALDATLNRYDLPAGALTIEITETPRSTDLAVAGAILTELVARGVQIALDDVGAGHTTLEALRILPLQLIKLDRTLVCPTSHGRDAAVRDGILAIAASLRIAVVAKGVETLDQLAEVNATACRYGQGRVFGRSESIAAMRRRPLDQAVPVG
jgi:diguanylate cyclase (GGDEF)-like protein